MYSKEENTPAANFKNQVHPMTKKARFNKIMKLQKEISKENEEKLIGKNVEVLVEGITSDDKYYVGRTYMDVPEIDGLAYIKIKNETVNRDLIGEYIKANIIDVKDYDLICEM